MHGLSGAVRCAVRISSFVRHKYVGDLYLFFAVRRTEYMHVCGVCMRWVRASTISNCSFDNSVEKLSDPTKRVALAAATSVGGEAY